MCSAADVVVVVVSESVAFVGSVVVEIFAEIDAEESVAVVDDFDDFEIVVDWQRLLELETVAAGLDHTDWR